jgi:hypothetical protein
MYNVKVYNAPLLIHYIYPWVGASCDGFVLDEKNKNGYLIEIKCPLARQLSNEIPEHYISQPRTQMEVVKANRCDFFECKLEEYSNHFDFINDTKTLYKGIIIRYTFFHDIDDNGYLKEHFYYPENIFNYDYNMLVKIVSQTFGGALNIQPIYWKLVDHRNHTIYRNPEWLKVSIPILEKCWNTIIDNRNAIEKRIDYS